jgi:hypothetical protein
MSLKKLTKTLRRAIENPIGYDNETYHKLKKQYREINKLRERLNNDTKASRGFGYSYAPIDFEQLADNYGLPESGIDLADAPGRGDDGVYSEGEQPEQPVESEG